jgi:hypothetical protein
MCIGLGLLFFLQIVLQGSKKTSSRPPELNSWLWTISALLSDATLSQWLLAHSLQQALQGTNEVAPCIFDHNATVFQCLHCFLCNSLANWHRMVRRQSHLGGMIAFGTRHH